MAAFAAVACTLLFITSYRFQKDVKYNLSTITDTGFVVMELFTSQGCSSCPPADAILALYANKKDKRIIPLAFHVDYWNHLGWIDSFSSSINSQRQRDYAEKFNLGTIYTPQLVINGRKQLIGSDLKKIEVIVKDLLKYKASVTIDATVGKINNHKIQVNYIVSKIFSNTSIHAVLVQQVATTEIISGENRGLELTNCNVVRNFKSSQLKGLSGNIILQMPFENISAKYQVIVFVQDNTSGQIYGGYKGSLL